MFKTKNGEPLEHWQAWKSALGSDRQKHWQPGRSAMLLAETWGNAGGFPPTVQSALQAASDLQHLTFASGIVEHETPLPGTGQASVADIQVLARDPAGRAILTVEGKVDEGFDMLVNDWLSAGKSENSPENRTKRLEACCERLGLRAADVGHLRYQLIHRTYAAVREAENHGADRAILLIHSFLDRRDREASGWTDFANLAAALGLDLDALRAGEPQRAPLRDDIALWLLWVDDAGGVPRP